MSNNLNHSLDAVLEQVVSEAPGVPGVVATLVDRQGTRYAGAAGKRQIGADASMTTDTVHAIFSTTKAIAATACLQLFEDGSLDLDAPAKNYAPDIGRLQVCEGFDDNNQPRLRDPKRDITTRMLLLHTAGCGYNVFNPICIKLVAEHGYADIISGSRAALNLPLMFDPGDQWEYGTNIDWAGQVVEGITGKRLGEVMAERIFSPLGMTSSAFSMTNDMRARRACVHQREADGSLTPLTEFELPPDPEVHMGGHGLYSTAEDYSRFIRMWLNDGAGDYGRVLKPETIHIAERNGLNQLAIKPLPGTIPALSHEAEFFPGLKKSWGLSFMINDETAPTGRPAGSLAWAGLANLYFWIDRKNGIGGFWATQILPFFDPTSLNGFYAFEKTAYDYLAKHDLAA